MRFFIFIALSGLICSGFAHATPAPTQIKPARLGKYKAATVAVLESSTLKCKSSGWSGKPVSIAELSLAIQKSQKGFVLARKQAPKLSFQYQLSIANGIEVELLLSADKNVTAVKAHQFKRSVSFKNVGTIEKPKFISSESKSKTGTAYCK